MKCNDYEYILLESARYRTKSHKYYPNAKSTLSRVEWIVNELGAAHAHFCMAKYTERFQQIKQDYEARSLKEEFSWVILSKISHQNARNYAAQIIKKKPIGESHHSATELAVEFIKSQNPNEKHGRLLPFRNYVLYLLHPCQLFKQFFGPNLFELVLFDADMYQFGLEGAYDISDETLIPFFQYLARYRVCLTVLDNSSSSGFRNTVITKLKRVYDRFDAAESLTAESSSAQPAGQAFDNELMIDADE